MARELSERQKFRIFFASLFGVAVVGLVSTIGGHTQEDNQFNKQPDLVQTVNTLALRNDIFNAQLQNKGTGLTAQQIEDIQTNTASALKDAKRADSPTIPIITEALSDVKRLDIEAAEKKLQAAQTINDKVIQEIPDHLTRGIMNHELLKTGYTAGTILSMIALLIGGIGLNASLGKQSSTKRGNYSTSVTPN